MTSLDFVHFFVVWVSGPKN